MLLADGKNREVLADMFTSQRLYPNPRPSLHLPLRRPIRTKAIQKGTMPHHRASYQLSDDERP
jgi:hypothetical protein